MGDTIYRNWQVSLLPYIGTNRQLSGNVVNKYSYNIFAGYSMGVRVMEVSSELGVGTTVTLLLPASPQATVEVLLDTEPNLPRGHGQLVLVVDDEVALRQVAGQMLETFGYQNIFAVPAGFKSLDAKVVEFAAR